MRTKQQIIPLSDLRHQFISSLNNFVDKTLTLQSAIKSALDCGAIPNEAVANLIRERLADLDAALFPKDDANV